ncbi:MAG: hypothetical protein U1F43_11095 [Myxococcota bacterium]
MLALTSLALASLASLIMMAAPAARAEDLVDGDGSLPGAAFGSLGLEIGHLSTKVAMPNPVTPNLAVPSELAGFFGQVRLKGGAFLRVTRFGSEAGLEGSFALGYASGGAIDPAHGGNLMIDLSAARWPRSSASTPWRCR